MDDTLARRRVDHRDSLLQLLEHCIPGTRGYGFFKPSDGCFHPCLARSIPQAPLFALLGSFQCRLMIRQLVTSRMPSNTIIQIAGTKNPAVSYQCESGFIL
jgi:hypothetical protein